MNRHLTYNTWWVVLFCEHSRPLARKGLKEEAIWINGQSKRQKQNEKNKIGTPIPQNPKGKDTKKERKYGMETDQAKAEDESQEILE